MTELAPQDFNYPDPQVLRNPYPFYKAMREQAPVFHEPKSGVFFVSRYDDVASAIRDPETFSSKRDIMPEVDPDIAAIRAKGFQDSIGLTTNDPPEHGRFRSIVNKIFTPRSFKAMEAGIELLCNRLVDGFIDKGEVELQREYAGPLPLTVIADLMGLPHGDLTELKRFSDDYTATMGNQAAPLPRHRMLECAQSLTDLQNYLARAIDARTAKPGDDIISQVLAANAVAKAPLNKTELVDLLRIFFIGGNETTTLAVGTMMKNLLSTGNYERLEADPSLITKAIEESLRHEAPNQWVLRNVMRDAELGGITIPKGSRACMLWGSANRDAAKFGEDAEEFRLDRPDSQNHMTFGFGSHFCAGSALARMEMRITLETFLRRLKNVRLKPGAPIRFNSHPLMRGLEALHLQFDKR
jgi:cytochrome P450